ILPCPLCRYDSYEGYEPRSERELYRSGYDYGDADRGGDADGYDGAYDGYYGGRPREHHPPRARDGYGPRGHGWARDGRNNRPVASPYAARSAWSEPHAAMGARGFGASRLPSLFSHNIIPELNAFPGMRGFAGGGRFGAGAVRPRKEPMAKKRKPTNSSDEPDSKAAKTDGSDNSDSENGASGAKNGEVLSPQAVASSSALNLPPCFKHLGALTIQEEISEIKRKLQAGKKTQERQKKRHRDRMVERIQFVCSLCKYRTFYDDEMSSHLESKFHKEHFKFVGTKLPQQTAEFLQEYVANKTRKTEERRRAVEDINGVIQQIYRDQDLTQDVGMEHFMKKVEAAHCAACDLFLPMQYGVIQKHLKSLDHNHNRRAMMEQSKKSSLVVARSILNNKLISKKLERYLKGENPFTDDPEEKEEHEEGEGGTVGNAEEEGNLEAEGAPAAPEPDPDPADNTDNAEQEPPPAEEPLPEEEEQQGEAEEDEEEEEPPE
uniref:A-kinase anchoring protein 8 like n=1 Tax=Nothoprocta perdicaria TaxID=30464 RepID=A0A8C6ZTH7_NOTPE